jgi:gliding motility-associated-like protein
MTDHDILMKKSVCKKFFFSFLILSLLLLNITDTFSQQKLWEDSFNGGVTTGGYSPDYMSGGTGKFKVEIEKGSTIKKAFLLVGRFGMAQPITITMNDKEYKLDKNNMGTVQFQSHLYGGASAVHVIDVTKDITAETEEYTIVVPQQTGPSNRFNDFYLFIAYENSSLKKVNAAIYLRNKDLAMVDNFKINLNNEINKNTDIGISLFCGYVCHMNGDGELVSINNEKLGQLGGHDNNGGYCGGPIGSFYYKDNKLFALQDDNNDKKVFGSDALINAKSILKSNSKSFEMKFEADDSLVNNFESNAVWGVIIAYGNDASTDNTECKLENAKVTDDEEICKGSSVKLTASGGTKYKWSTGDETSTVEVKPEATTTYFVTITDDKCTAKDSVTIKVNKTALADAGSDTTMCSGGTVKLTAKGGTAYAWSDGEKTQSIEVKPQETMTYTVTVTSGSCSAMDKVTVTVNKSISVDAGRDTTVCSGSTVTLKVRGGNSYHWSNGEKTQSISIKPHSTTTYYVTVTSGSCTATDDVVVTVKPIPGIDAASDVYVTPDSSAVINLKGPDGKYKWWPAAGLSCTECKSPTVSPDSTTTYYVYYVTENGCSATDSVKIHSKEVQAYYVTNPFTPNGDGNNDVFMISLRRGKLLDFSISNKDSKIVFKSTGEIYEWNGKYNDGSDAPTGSYIYSLDYTDEEGKKVQKSGAFNLIR